MVTQWIITGIILVAATVWAGYKIYKYFFIRPKRKSTACDDFSGDCTECIKYKG